MSRCAVVVGWLAAACGSESGSSIDAPEGGISLIGECDRPQGSVEVATAAVTSFDLSCLRADAPELVVIEDLAQWDALFSSCTRPVPPELDLAVERGAVLRDDCSRIDLRFAVETSAEVVVGMLERLPGGPCGGNLLIVPLPRSTKAVRSARCQESCPTCPPPP